MYAFRCETLITVPYIVWTLSNVRFIYAAEDIELVDYITSLRVSNSSNQAVVLFPSSRAVSSDDFMTTWNEQTDPVYSQTNDEFHTSTLPGLKCSEENRNDAKINIPVKPRKLAIIVVVSGIMLLFSLNCVM